MKKILVMNLGSTSSKLAYYEDETQIFKCTLDHPAADLQGYKDLLDQYQYRFDAICAELKERGVDYRQMNAIVSRGGHFHPMAGGTYLIDKKMLGEIRSGVYGRHACDLGSFISQKMAEEGRAVPMVVDPPITDEFSDIARYSGLKELPRSSQFHALNQRAVARQYAKDHGLNYEELDLIVVHMGGGTSVAVHQHGRMVDANSGLYTGPFSTNRAGDVPSNKLVRLCFSGQYTEKEIMLMLNGNGGLMSYLQESDVRTVQRRAESGDAAAAEALEAMIYQTCKEIGAMAAVLSGQVDAIVITGGIANSEYIINEMKNRIRFITQNIAVYPGELEMQALAFGALEGLRDASKILRV